MSKREIIKRYMLLVLGLLIAGFGIAFTKCGGLGVSPISSVSNVLSIKFEAVSMGTWLMMWNFLMIVAQALILRKDFKPIELLQVVISVVLGYFTDFGMWSISGIPTDTYFMKMAFVMCGVVVLGLGLSLTFISDVVLNAGEALVKVISNKVDKEVSDVKIIFDVSNVLLSIVLSMILFNFKIVGAREGTIIAAFGTGLCVKFFNRILKKPLERIITR